MYNYSYLSKMIYKNVLKSASPEVLNMLDANIKILSQTSEYEGMKHYANPIQNTCEIHV